MDEEARGIVEALYGDGITARKGAFPTAWVDRLNEDVLAAFEEAPKETSEEAGRAEVPAGGAMRCRLPPSSSAAALASS